MDGVSAELVLLVFGRRKGLTLECSASQRRDEGRRRRESDSGGSVGQPPAAVTLATVEDIRSGPVLAVGGKDVTARQQPGSVVIAVSTRGGVLSHSHPVSADSLSLHAVADAVHDAFVWEILTRVRVVQVHDTTCGSIKHDCCTMLELLIHHFYEKTIFVRNMY